MITEFSTSLVEGFLHCMALHVLALWIIKVVYAP